MSATAMATQVPAKLLVADVLARLEAAGVHLRAEAGELVATPRKALTDELRALAKAHRAELLRVLHSIGATNGAKGRTYLPKPTAEAENRRQQAIAMLERNPTLRIAVVCNSSGDPVRLAVAIRDRGTCEVHIPAARFDPFALIELVGKHGGRVH